MSDSMVVESTEKPADSSAGADGKPSDAPLKSSTTGGASPTSQEEKPKPVAYIHEPGIIESVLGAFGMFAWTVLFAVGVVVPSEPFRNKLANPLTITFSEHVYNGLIFLFSYTITNVAILCVLAGFVGELGRRTRIGGVEEGLPLHRGTYVAAMMRGFLTYLIILSGTVLIANRQVLNPTPEEYIRMAGMISVVGFLAGYNPGMFAALQTRFADTFKLNALTGTPSSGPTDSSGTGAPRK